jgi:hypothetical protein
LEESIRFTHTVRPSSEGRNLQGQSTTSDTSRCETYSLCMEYGAEKLDPAAIGTLYFSVVAFLT